MNMEALSAPSVPRTLCRRVTAELKSSVSNSVTLPHTAAAPRARCACAHPLAASRPAIGCASAGRSLAGRGGQLQLPVLCGLETSVPRRALSVRCHKREEEEDREGGGHPAEKAEGGASAAAAAAGTAAGEEQTRNREGPREGEEQEGGQKIGPQETREHGRAGEEEAEQTLEPLSAEDQSEFERRRQRAVERALRRQPAWSHGLVGDLLYKGRRGLEALMMTTRDEDIQEQKSLDLNKILSCLSYNDFWSVEQRRYGLGGMFVGNLRAPVEEAREKLLPKLSEAAGVPVDLFFLVDDNTDRQVLVVQPAADVQQRLDLFRMRGFVRWPLAVLGACACAVTSLGISGVSFDPQGLGSGPEHALQFALGLAAVIGVGETFERIVADRYGVSLGPPYLIPGPLGCLGAATRVESLVPSRQAMLDIASARAVGSLVTGLMLATYALLTDGGVLGGDDPLYVEPSFFDSSSLVSFVQYIIGPYADDLGNVMPHALEGVGVPVNPLAFAGLLGIVSTALNLLPGGQLEGGRIAQAVLGRRQAKIASFATTLVLGILGISGSVLCLTWSFVLLFFRNGPELPCLDEVTPISKWRIFLAWFLLGSSLLLLLPNSAGTFPTFFNTSAF